MKVRGAEKATMVKQTNKSTRMSCKRIGDRFVVALALCGATTAFTYRSAWFERMTRCSGGTPLGGVPGARNMRKNMQLKSLKVK